LIQKKAAEFKVNGEKLILAGHSMGGAHVQILSAMESTTDVDGIVTLAPGHMPHLSTNFQNTIASDVSTARQLVANGQGSTIGTYQTPNSDTIVNISLPDYVQSSASLVI
jgi:pimeloyl-ACP methyl ester carboxylesterase